MTRQTQVRAVAVGGLVVASAGLVISQVGGVEMPPVPPALILMVAAAICIAVVRRRWTFIAGVVAAAAELAGLIAFGAMSALGGAESAMVVLGAWARLLGVVAAIVAGTLAAVMASRPESAHREQMPV